MCYGFKYLKNKPVRDLKGDQFLRVVQAEQDGLLITAIRIDLDTSSDGRSFSTYFDEIKQYFYRVCYYLALSNNCKVCVGICSCHINCSTLVMEVRNFVTLFIS